MLCSTRASLAAAGPLRRAQQQQQRCKAQGFPVRRSKTRVRAQGDEGEPQMESLFEQELRRRGLESASFDASDAQGSAEPRSPLEQQGQQQRRTAPRPPPSFRGQADYDVPPQLQQSRALNSEGLEGFIPRATELLKLGVTFFLAFLPFIAVVSLAFGAIYAVFGDAFVHGGSPSSGPPPYIDPDLLLAEPTADPMIPLDLR